MGIACSSSTDSDWQLWQWIRERVNEGIKTISVRVCISQDVVEDQKLLDSHSSNTVAMKNACRNKI